MDADEFLDEALSSGLAPSNFREIYLEFREFQNLAIATLNEFAKVCKTNEIPYVLAYGSLLGAVRDGGQIPWDYDVDVFVPFEERQRLVDALNHDLNANYYFYCPEINPKCRHEFIRIAPKGYRTEELHVDVFYLTGAPDDIEETKRLAKEIARLAKIRYFKLVDARYASYGRLKVYFYLIAQKLLYIFNSAQRNQDKFLELCNMYATQTSQNNITADTFSKDYLFDSQGIWDMIEITTRDGIYKISSQYNEALTHVYGDYLKVPPLEARIKEVVRHYDRLTKFAKI